MSHRFPEHDAALRQWFDAQGWPVDRTGEDFDRSLFVWRDTGRPSHALYVSQAVLEDTPASELIERLDPLKVAALMRAYPNVYSMLIHDALGKVVLVQPSELPT